MKRNRNDRRPTWTSLVLDALVQADDFLNLTEIMARTGASMTRATAALHHLCKSRAIESVVGGDEKLWWFATPEQDSRLRHVDERVPEEPGSRRKRKSRGLHLPPSDAK